MGPRGCLHREILESPPHLHPTWSQGSVCTHLCYGLPEAFPAVRWERGVLPCLAWGRRDPNATILDTGEHFCLPHKLLPTGTRAPGA